MSESFVDGKPVYGVDFMDGSRVTPGTEGCKCDTNGRQCEHPCWMRIGMTTDPCCKDCAPLPPIEEEEDNEGLD